MNACEEGVLCGRPLPVFGISKTSDMFRSLRAAFNQGLKSKVESGCVEDQPPY